MLDLESIYKNVSVEDVLLYFSPITPYPREGANKFLI